jgi:sugar phosphate isomerase/epimerase
MDIGIFAKTFGHVSADVSLRAVRSYGLSATQFNMVCTGLSSLPESIPAEVAASVGAAARKHDVDVVAVSGTFNMIHPDPRVRENGLRRLQVLAAACESMGTPVITLCTGTRNPHDKWQRHPANDDPDAWDDLLVSMERALAITKEYDIVLAFEPEHANVVNTAEKGRRLIEALGSPRLKVVFDPANLFKVASAPERKRLVEEGLDLLADRTVIAHAKDRRADGTFCAAGQGVLDYAHYIGALQATRPDVPLVLHGLEVQEVPVCVSFLREHLQSNPK